ncbi:MAG: hypothetical protein D6B25_14055 [Desulfobulbaceae bacterium]|nr:MAG: hypothetical protein D6B25_14055 [Desulfobulbaceae bacterium]
MFIQWSESLEIGNPLVDSEHRYLVQLLNNLHDQFEAGKEAISLAKVFSHLAQYVRVHFENEEALMVSIDYQGLEEHRLEHKKLMEQAMELSEDYMEGEQSVTAETLDFLRNWAVNHIAGSDMKLKGLIPREQSLLSTQTPAFAAHSGPEFKVCTLCGKKWQTYDELKNDKDKIIKGVQLDLTNHLYNLILFNCSCDTTLGMFIKEFVTQSDILFEIEENIDPERRPDHCLRIEEGETCLQRCACQYTSKLLKALE